MSETNGSIDAARIVGLLEHRYPSPEWARFVELRGGTGYSNQQRLDFFVMNLWPSKKFHSIAFEIKVSRQDFSRELSVPTKRAFAESVAHECWFAMPHGLAQPDEIPEGWGLIVANAGGLRAVKMPMQRATVKRSDAFIAAIARRSEDPVPKTPAAAWKVAGKELDEAALLALVEEMHGKVREQMRFELERELNDQFRDSPDYKSMCALRSAVMRAYGLDYRDDPVKAFEAARNGGANAPSASTRRQLDYAISMLRKIQEEIEPPTQGALLEGDA